MLLRPRPKASRGLIGFNGGGSGGGGGGGGGGGEANKKAEEKKNMKEEDHIHQGVVSNFHDPRTCPECQRIVFVPLDNRAWNSEPNPSSCSIM